MRKLKLLWRHALPPRVREELETWTEILLVVSAGVLLFATLKAQLARGDIAAVTHATRPTMAAEARGTPWWEAHAHAVPAPGLPPRP